MNPSPDPDLAHAAGVMASVIDLIQRWPDSARYERLFGRPQTEVIAQMLERVLGEIGHPYESIDEVVDRYAQGG